MTDKDDNWPTKPTSAPPPAPMHGGIPAMSDGRVLVNASKYLRHITIGVFHMIGGQQKLYEMAQEDPKWFMDKFIAKLVTAEREAPQSEETVEDLLEKLDRQVIDVEVTRVEE